MSEEELLKKYGCNSLPEFIDTYLDCETAFDLLRSQFKEIERLNNIIEHIENICKSSIASVDKILLDEKEIKFKNGILQNRNNYQIVRLKAYRTKSKEILGRIKELKGSDK